MTMLNRLDHVGVVVANLDQAMRFCSEVLGLEKTREFTWPERHLRAAFYSLGNAQIELIEIADPEQRRQRLGEGNVARIEHIAVGTDDINAAIERLRAAGVDFQGPAAHFGANLLAFTQADTSGGIVYQLIQPAPQG